MSCTLVCYDSIKIVPTMFYFLDVLVACLPFCILLATFLIPDTCLPFCILPVTFLIPDTCLPFCRLDALFTFDEFIVFNIPLVTTNNCFFWDANVNI